MKATRKWVVVAMAICTLLAAVAPDIAEAKGKGGGGSRGRGGRGGYSRGGSGMVNTPYGRMQKYRPTLQTPAQF